MPSITWAYGYIDRSFNQAPMIRAFRTVVAIAGLLGGIGFVRAGLWFLRDAPGAGKASEGPPAASVTVLLPGFMYSLAAMGLGLGLVLLWLSGREMLRLWRSGPPTR